MPIEYTGSRLWCFFDETAGVWTVLNRNPIRFCSASLGGGGLPPESSQTMSVGINAGDATTFETSGTDLAIYRPGTYLGMVRVCTASTTPESFSDFASSNPYIVLNQQFGVGIAVQSGSIAADNFTGYSWSQQFNPVSNIKFTIPAGAFGVMPDGLTGIPAAPYTIGPVATTLDPNDTDTVNAEVVRFGIFTITAATKTSPVVLRFTGFNVTAGSGTLTILKLA